jgi:hypothetical protein
MNDYLIANGFREIFSNISGMAVEDVNTTTAYRFGNMMNTMYNDHKLPKEVDIHTFGKFKFCLDYYIFFEVYTEYS